MANGMIPDHSKEEWCVLWDRAKDIERQLPELRRQAFAQLKARFPDIEYKAFHTLCRACQAGKLPDNLATEVAQHHERISALEEESRTSRARSDQLLAEKQASDTRVILDPSVDPIPAGRYPKLRQCRTYPLRQDCNYGDNETSKWERCEYMKYDDSCSILDPNRWKCTAPE